MKKKLLFNALTLLIFLNYSPILISQTFNTEGVHDVQITAGTSITINADGAHGGNRTFTNNPGGSGGDITATFNVNTGDYIRVIVGGAGASATNDGGGGGGTAIINCGNSLTNCDNNLGTLLVVAGAGGGAGGNSNGGGAVTTAGAGGNGSNGAQGNSSATQASCNVYGGGGSHPGNGYGHGAPGFGGNGGGGAGYTGGDGVAGQNGADGGSNFIDASATSSTNNPGATGGGTGADGIVTLSNATTNLISSQTCTESLAPEELNFNTEGVHDLQITAGTSITIDADGAHGGNRTFTNNPGGSGGDITATFNVNTGDYIRVIVGGTGASATNDGGGGGGTAIINCGNSLANCDNNMGTLLVVAGAGGGAGGNSNGGGAVTTAGAGGNGSNGAQGNSSATQASCNVYGGGGSHPGNGYGHGAPGFGGNGGGGAGYTGGDGVAGQNGADGGSNFIDASATSSTNLPGTTGGGTGTDGIVNVSALNLNLISSETCAESIVPEELNFNTEGVHDLQVTNGTSITIDADGAHGGNRTFTNNPGGSGGDITATFNVNSGDYIRVIVGGAGASATNDGGGGGGTAIINCGNSLTNCDNNLGTLLVVAGAGGGAGGNSNGGGAVTTAGAGGDGSNGAQGNSSATQAECNIYGGVGATPGDGYGHGGAGFSGNGGGGAGYTGGDGVAGQNGADGGSNFIDASATSSSNNPGATGGGTGADGIVNVSALNLNLISSETCAESLPVELITFYARLLNQNTQLTWQTASEINNEGFEIEWAIGSSQSAVREWATIGFVNGKGTTLEKQSYTFTHKNPARGVNYYRLKQLDYDGLFEYSDVAAVELPDFGNLEVLRVTPNPIQNGQFTLTLPEIDFETAEFTLYNAQGQLIQTQQITDLETVIQTDNLPKGMYLVVADINGNHLLERLVVQ